MTQKFKHFLFGLYICLYLRFKDIIYNEFTTLTMEQESVKKFRSADKLDISKFDDVCAICLAEMKNARITDCHHIFHDHCLSLALKSSPNCPTCKTSL